MSSSTEPGRYVSPPQFEPLEERLLLTTLIGGGEVVGGVIGGEVFEYYDASEHTIRVSLAGNIIVELIGADLDDTNTLLLGDIPGKIYESLIGRQDTEILGGVGGADGVELIGSTPITDPDADEYSIPWVTEGVESIVLEGLASRDVLGNGDTYAFNVANVTIDSQDRLVIQLVQLDNGDGDGTSVAMLHQATLREDIMSNLSVALANVNAFAVNPTNGSAYAVDSGILYRIERVTGVVTPIGALGLTDVNAMAFDSSGALYVIGMDTLLNAKLDRINPATAATISSTNIQIGDDSTPPVLVPSTDTYSAMVFHGGGLYAASQTVGGGGSSLHQINLNSGRATVIGDLQLEGGDSLVIEGMALSVDTEGIPIIVGVDHSQSDDTTGAVMPRLTMINYTTPGECRALSTVGTVNQQTVATVKGLASYTDPGDTRPLFYATDGINLIRGSAVTLPTSPDDGMSAVESILAADFRPLTGHPNDGLLYFVASVSEESTTPAKLYTIDVTKPNRSAIQNSMTVLPGTLAEGDSWMITSIAWDQTAPNAAQLVGFMSDGSDGFLVTIDETDIALSTIGPAVEKSVDGVSQPISNVSGIEFVRDDTSQVEPYLYAVCDAEDDSDLIRIDRVTGTTYILGPLPDPDDIEDDTESPIRGSDLGGLAWNPTQRNPFTGVFGVLIATDVTSDELVYVDDRPRFPDADVFAIYVAYADEDASISIAVVPDFDPDDPDAERDMEPFDGGNVVPPEIRVIPAQGGDMIMVSADDGTGGVYIGARTEDIPDVDGEDMISVIAATLGEQIGVRPANFDDWPIPDPSGFVDYSAFDLSAGIVVSENILEFVSQQPDMASRLMGQNLDWIVEMAISRDGRIVVADSDGLGPDGVWTGGDELAFIDPVTGLALETPKTINDPVTGLPMTGIAGLDYGDIDFDGQELLYGIFNVEDHRPILSNSLGAGVTGNGDYNFQALTVTVGQVIYAINDNGGTFELYRIDLDPNTGLVDTIGLLGGITDVMGRPITDVSALESHPITGELYVVGNNAVLHPGGDQELFIIDPTPGHVTAVSRAVLNDGGVVTDTIKALAFDAADPDNIVLYGVRDTGVDTLITIDFEGATAGTVQEAPALGQGDIKVLGSTTDIVEMDFTFTGTLVGVDKSGGPGAWRLVLVETGRPTMSKQMTLPGSVDDNLRGYASNRYGAFYSIWDNNAADNELWKSREPMPTLGNFAEDLIPSVETGGFGNGELGAEFITHGLTVTDAGSTFMVVDTAGVLELYQIDRDPTTGAVTGTTLVGPIVIIDPVTSTSYAITGIEALEYDPILGMLLVVGEDATNLPGVQQLWRIDSTTGEAQFGGLPLYDITLSDVTETFKALAYKPDPGGGFGTLYGVRDAAGGETLVMIDQLLGLVDDVGGVPGAGGIEVASTPTDIIGMDFNFRGELVGIDDSGGAGNRRLVELSLTNPSSSTEMTAPGTVSDDLADFSSDTGGYFYSIYYTVGNDSQLWINQGYVYTQIGVVGGGSVGHVRAMAFSLGEGSLVGQQGLYIIDDANNLVEIDPTTAGIVATIGPVTDAATGHPVVIESMDFDQNNVLFGHDILNGRLMDIDIATAIAGDNVATTGGSFRPTVGAMAHDWINERYLAVDNSTSSLAIPVEGHSIESSVLVELRGTTNDDSLGQNVGNVLIGGTLTGKVHTAGGFDIFYAGWLITGETGGQGEAPPSIEDNFYVASDLRNLIVSDSIGTNDDTGADGDPTKPQYMSGFDLNVGGKLGYMLTLDSLIGWVDVGNQDVFSAEPMSSIQSEVEKNPLNEDGNEGILFQRFELYRDDGAFYNETFYTPQYLATARGTTLGADEEIIVSGYLYSEEAGDMVDYYAVGLMAGQTVEVQILGGVVGVVDPDGRRIASNVSDVDSGAVYEEPFRFTADRPGAYRFLVVGGVDDEGGFGSGVESDASYTLMISDVGDLALGGLVARTNILASAGLDPTVYVRDGDAGAIVAEQFLISNTPLTVLVENGNLRVVEAGQMGVLTDDATTGGIDLAVPNGSIGLLRTGGGAVSEGEGGADGGDADGGPPTAGEGMMLVDLMNVGGDVQTIDCAGRLLTNLEVDGGLGVLRAGSMAWEKAQSTITVNADNVGNDGIIDLIDIAGDLGTLTQGGPVITTGPGGNVRYMRVGGAFYDDYYFGTGGTGENYVQLAVGESATIRDDGGAWITIKPTHILPDNYDTGGNFWMDVTEAASLQYRTFGIRGSGGSVLVDVISDGGAEIIGDDFGVGAGVEISRIEVQGTGRDVTTDEDGNLVIEPVVDDPFRRIYRYRLPDGSFILTENPGPRLDVLVTGKNGTVVDVFDVVGANFTRISNNTGGEIVNVTADSIGELYSAGTLGLAKRHTGAAVNPISVVSDEYPFQNQRIGIVAEGDVVWARARGALGNLIVTGSIGEATADYGDVDEYGVFEGIAAPIYAGGDLHRVNIGEGLAPTGNGGVAHSGIYADGIIRSVVGTNADIRGNIVASGGIESVRLTNGSIINVNIQAPGSLDMSLETAVGITYSGNVDNIDVTGGGIIGLRVGARNIGDTTIRDGFGLFNSVYSVPGVGTIGNVTADGYGVRIVTFHGGSSQGDIIATGQGELLSTLAYSPTVRYSETFEYDPIHDQRINRLNDLHKVLGTSVIGPTRVDLSEAGVIDDVYAHGSGDLGVVSAYRIQAIGHYWYWWDWGWDWLSEWGITPTTDLDFANSIEGVRTIDSMSDLEMTTGSLGFFEPGADVSNLDMKIAGAINKMIMKGNMLDGSLIQAFGPNGDIRYVRIYGNMDGDISATGRIRTIIIDGDLTGNIYIEATTPGTEALRTLKLGGSLIGSLDIYDNVGTIDVAGSLGGGSAVDHLLIRGNLKKLKVGKKIPGSSLALDLDIEGNLGVLDVYGQMTGDMFVGGDLNRMYVRASGTSGDIVTGDIDILGDARTIYLIGNSRAGLRANLASNINVGGDVRSFYIKEGSMTAAGSLTSSLGDIRSAKIRNGQLLGAVRAPNGTIKKLEVRGSNLNGGWVEAQSFGSLRFDGSLINGAVITTTDGTGELKKLYVGGSVDATSIINAGYSGKIDVRGSLLGDLWLNQYYSRSTKIDVRGDLGGQVYVDADTSMTVRGSVLSMSTVLVRRDMKKLTVVGAMMGDVLVDGAGGSFKLGSLGAGVITTGFDLKKLTIMGTMNNALVQVGYGLGVDGILGTGDLFEGGRMATLKKLDVRGLMTSSVVASGGEISKALIRGGMTNSSISSGLVLDGAAIADVIADGTPLANIPELDNARAGATLYRGDFRTADVRGLLDNSDLTAGVAPNPTGSFDGITAASAANVTSSITGGRSEFRTVKATVGGGSNVLADSGIRSVRRIVPAGGNVVSNVDYTIGDIATLETLRATVVKGAPQTYTTSTGTVIITVKGNGQVEVYDGNTGDDRIDTLVIRGADKRTSVKVETIVGAVPVGRVITADDVELREFRFDGDIVGTTGAITGETDIWMDGPVRTFAIRDLGSDIDGKIGGDVRTMSMRTQGAGKLHVGGKVSKLTIANSASSPLLRTWAGVTAPSGGINAMSTDSTGATWVFDSVTNALTRVTPVAAGLSVTDSFTGETLTLSGMDFNGGDVLYAVANLWNPSPTEQVGAMSATAVSLRGLAVGPDGRIVAIDSSSGTDVLVEVDSSTGFISQVGILRDIFGNTYAGNVLAMSFDDNGNLFALVNDRDGDGGAYTTADGVALVKMQSTDDNHDGYLGVSNPITPYLPGQLLAGGVANDFRGMAIDGAIGHGGTIYAIRRDLADTLDDLVTIRTDGLVTPVGPGAGTVKLGLADTVIRGIGFDASGNLLALNNDPSGAELIAIDMADPAASVGLGAPDILDVTLDGFAVGRSGANFRSYAFDTDDIAGGIFYANPTTPVATLGIVDTTTGIFTQLRPLAEDFAGAPIDSTVVDIAVDTTSTGNIFIVMSNSELFAYDAADGAVVSIFGAVTDSNTMETLGIVGMDFDAAGDLIAADASYNRLVTILLPTSLATPRTETGSVDGTDLTAMAYDPSAGVFHGFSDSTDTFVEFRGTTQNDLGGIYANSIKRLNITGPGTYSGRVVATGNSFRDVRVSGSFAGTLLTWGEIRKYTQIGGDFSGTLFAGDGMRRVTIKNGNFLLGGTVESNGTIKTFRISGGGTFDGTLMSAETRTVRVDGPGSGYIRVTGNAGNIQFTGMYSGTTVVGSASRQLRYSGGLGASANVTADGDVRSIILGPTAGGSSVIVDGYVRSLTVNGTHSGMIAIGQGLSGGKMRDIFGGFVSVGYDTRSFSVRGNTTDSVISFGTWIGDDGVYNTADDVITGGSVKSASFSGFFRDSAVVAGVLPDQQFGPGVSFDNRAYVGNPGSSDIATIDSAEAGGILESYIHKLTIRGDIVNSWPSAGRQSVAAADGFGKIKLNSSGPALTIRSYGDPFGAPTLVAFTRASDNEIRVVFSEEINTASFVLSVDTDNDGLLTGLADIQGTVTIMDVDGNYVDDVQLLYTTQTGEHGKTQGVLRILRSGGFSSTESYSIILSGNIGGKAIYDRSSLRSALRDLNQNGVKELAEDTPGTILDGDNNGIEGGTISLIAITEAADTFVDALDEAPLPLTTPSTVFLSSTFEGGGDVDVYHFAGTEYEYFSVRLQSDDWLDPNMALYLWDDQGTIDPDDDEYELVAQYEAGDYGFQAYELPATGEYFLEVTELSDGSGSYSLELKMAASDI